MEAGHLRLGRMRIAGPGYGLRGSLGLRSDDFACAGGLVYTGAGHHADLRNRLSHRFAAGRSAGAYPCVHFKFDSTGHTIADCQVHTIADVNP